MDGIRRHRTGLPDGLAGRFRRIFGGLALVFGLLTRPAAVVTAFTMLVALFAVHIGNGFFLTSNGIEYALILSAASIAIALQGPGKWSLDQAISNNLR